MDKPYIKLAGKLGAVTVLWIVLLSRALAASPPLPANTPTPGQVQSTLPTAPPPPQPKSGPEFSPPPSAPSAVAPGGPTVPVESFEITGNSIVLPAGTGWDHPTGFGSPQAANFVTDALDRYAGPARGRFFLINAR